MENKTLKLGVRTDHLLILPKTQDESSVIFMIYEIPTAVRGRSTIDIIEYIDVMQKKKKKLKKYGDILFNGNFLVQYQFPYSEEINWFFEILQQTGARFSVKFCN